MTVRSLRCSLPLLFLALFAAPLTAQANGYQWSSRRPDARGPAGVTDDWTLPADQFQIGFRYFHVRMEGEGVGTDSLSVNQVLTLFDVAPSAMVAQGLAVDLLWGVTDHLTLAATGTFAQKTMDNLAPVEGQSNFYLFYQTEAKGLEDVRLSALYNVYDRGAIRAHVQGGISLPVGAIDARDRTAASPSRDTQLPYPLQLGSGTFDLMPGFTVNIQNEKASLGLQGKATIRLGENDRGWALGDLYEGNLWAGLKANEWASVSIGARYSNWGDVEGFDEALDPNESPAHNTLTQSGWRVDLPIGLNLVMPEGRFGGHRLSVEGRLPIHQDLDGPQLKHDWTVAVRWEKAFSF